MCSARNGAGKSLCCRSNSDPRRRSMLSLAQGGPPMRHLLTICVWLLALADFAAYPKAARAADIPLPTKAPPQAPAYDWTGFYVGVHYGYAAGSSRWSAIQTGAVAPPLSGSL